MATWRGGWRVLLAPLLLLLAALAEGRAGEGGEEEERLIGWQGATYVPKETGNSGVRQSAKLEPWLEAISWQPRAFVYHNFLTPEECEHLIHLASPHMEKSTVVDTATGESVPSEVRTSSGTFLSRGMDAIVKKIEDRIATFSFIPVDHGEGLQILQYEIGQKYEPHYDYFDDKFNVVNGGQRIATLLMYLTDVEEGGETVFPSSTPDKERPDFSELSSCAQQGKSVRPHRGDAVLFWSLQPNGSDDPSSLHGSCPVIRGIKWSATKWMRQFPYAV